MQFRTQIPIPKSKHPLDYNSKIVSLGSCFAENIADKFDYFKFQNTSNPFGIIFNPISIEKIIQRIVQKKYFIEETSLFSCQSFSFSCSFIYPPPFFLQGLY